MLLLDIEPKKVEKVVKQLPDKEWIEKRGDPELLQNEFLIGQLAWKLGKPVPEYRMTEKGLLLVEKMRKPNLEYMKKFPELVAAKLAEFHAPFAIYKGRERVLLVLIHGDLTPENIVWGKDHRPIPQLIDLEFAKVMEWGEEAQREQQKDIHKLFLTTHYDKKERERFLKIYRAFFDLYKSYAETTLRNAV
ncbi:MAG: phosphotransferase [Candidatus Micrarchaeota archaeon]|nr:phosphotransferase [Candidatus Micrarchaeota archaeon]